ncbi:unnamed protein product, partial [Allacma fusca]
MSKCSNYGILKKLFSVINTSINFISVDRIAQEFVQHITALKAREKTQLEFISSMYTDNM